MNITVARTSAAPVLPPIKDITVTMSPEQFAKMRALAGQCAVGTIGDMFDAMEAASKEHGIPRYGIDDTNFPPLTFHKKA